MSPAEARMIRFSPFTASCLCKELLRIIYENLCYLLCTGGIPYATHSQEVSGFITKLDKYEQFGMKLRRTVEVQIALSWSVHYDVAPFPSLHPLWYKCKVAKCILVTFRKV
jgi:hypothetical protein